MLTALGLDFFTVSALGKGFRVLQYITELFIVIGFIRLFLKPKGFKSEYIGLTAVAAVILFACIVIPRFSSYLNVQRFYHIGLFLLAPLCILGGEVIWDGASKLFRLIGSWSRHKVNLAPTTNMISNNSLYLRFLSLAILIPYFLFNSGFFFEISSSRLYGVIDSPSSIALSGYRLDIPLFNQKEAEAVVWLAENIDDKAIVYGDEYGRLLLFEQLDHGQVGIIPIGDEVPENAYVFLRTWNMEKQEIGVLVTRGVYRRFGHVSLNDMPGFFKKKWLVYNNGGAQILAPPLPSSPSLTPR